MAGGFAHITAAAEALGRLGEVEGLTAADKMSITQFIPFVEVGAVGPDYPYLGGQSEWADKMHYRETGEVIRNGVRILRDYEPGGARSRCLAWILGYAAHVATDLTIHPIVQARVGPYEQNKTQHRTCEMNQDAFIWHRRNLGELGLADYFRVNITQCSTDEGRLNTDVVELWQQMLELTYPDDVANDPPEFDRWNTGFRRIVDTIDDLGSFFSFTRHLLASQGVAYPSTEGVDMTFIENLDTPEGKMHYSDIFDRAVGSIVTVWSHIGIALHAPNQEERDQALALIPDGNLDTGEALASNELIFWSAA
tara:strand:- start:2346 stop:3272 length:927 start_codon:yes stop_codon:yes gene_type:complete